LTFYVRKKGIAVSGERRKSNTLFIQKVNSATMRRLSRSPVPLQPIYDQVSAFSVQLVAVSLTTRASPQAHLVNEDTPLRYDFRAELKPLSKAVYQLMRRCRLGIPYRFVRSCVGPLRILVPVEAWRRCVKSVRRKVKPQLENPLRLRTQRKTVRRKGFG
jgi:hypothetical protein